jgi:DNA-binding GntR family transcriptional regulator
MQRTVLVEEIRDYLRDAIINLRFKPGEQLNESFILSELDVSRSPLREALRLLQGEGLVTWRSHKGVYVNKISADDVRELFPIRANLESLAAELAASRLTDREIRELEAIVDRMEKATEQGNTKLSVKLNFDFHRHIVKGAGNRRLEEIIKNVGRQSMWFMFALICFKKAHLFALEGHRDIFLALKNRDSRLAAERIKDHINSGAARIIEFFSSDEWQQAKTGFTADDN